MVEKQAFPGIECSKRLHILGRQREIKYIEVFFHSAPVCGFRYHDYSLLDQKAKGGLCGGLSIFAADTGKDGVCKEAVFPFRERPPSLRLYAILSHRFTRVHLLVENMSLHLIDGGNNVCKQA